VLSLTFKPALSKRELSVVKKGIKQKMSPEAARHYSVNKQTSFTPKLSSGAKVYPSISMANFLPKKRRFRDGKRTKNETRRAARPTTLR
jgi:hypothetical protein